MTIQRQYSLPNCSLILEGLSTNGESGTGPMSVLLNMECHLPGAASGPLSGGREFLDHLVLAVSNYAQRLLSGVAHPMPSAEGLPLVELKPGEGPYHHLIVRSDKPAAADDAIDASATAPLDIRLSTVQFYDLMEAVDQLLADTQTLPDLGLSLNPVPRRFVKPTEPVAKRAAPAVIGASALAAAALGLFFVPPPKVEPGRTSGAAVTEPANTGANKAVETTPPAGATSTPTPTATAEAARPDAATAAANVDTLAQAPAITDPAVLASLQEKIQKDLQDRWKPTALPQETWTYRIAVSQGGQVLGYKYDPKNDAALENVDSTPLPQVVYTAVDPTQPETEPVAQFMAQFTPEGTVVLEPYSTPEAASKSAEGSQSAEAELAAIANPIEDASQIERLNRALRSKIIENRKAGSFSQDVTYRVRLNGSGEVVGFKPNNEAAQTAAAQTPLPSLLTSGDNDSAQADFKVVFTQDGVVEVSPWNGWPK